MSCWRRGGARRIDLLSCALRSDIPRIRKGSSTHAKTGSCSQSQAGQTRWQIGEHAGRRIRQGPDRQDPEGQAWCAVDQASHCHRPLRGAPRRRRPTATTKRADQEVNAPQCQIRVRGRPGQTYAEAPAESIARCRERSEERATFDCIAQRAVEARQACGEPANRRIAFGRSPKGEPHQGSQVPLRGREEGGAHQSEAQRLISCSELVN